MQGTAERPRLNVYRSLNHIYVQVIDDLHGKTLVSASTAEGKKEDDRTGGNVASAKAIGKTIAERAKAKARRGRGKSHDSRYIPDVLSLIREHRSFFLEPYSPPWLCDCSSSSISRPSPMTRASTPISPPTGCSMASTV